MTESTAIIFSALIAGGTAILSITANEVFRYWTYCRRAKEHIAQAILPHRLQAAQDIFRTIASRGVKVFNYHGLGDIKEGLEELYDNLSDVRLRNAAIIGKEISENIDTILDFVKSFHDYIGSYPFVMKLQEERENEPGEGFIPEEIADKVSGLNLFISSLELTVRLYTAQDTADEYLYKMGRADFDKERNEIKRRNNKKIKRENC